MARDLTVLIMAAGHGTRMRSRTPKVLHPVCGRPMVLWVVAAAERAGAARVVCVTRPGEGVDEWLAGRVETASQTEGEGTGSAVLAARAAIEAAGTVVVLSGDHPLMAPELIAQIVATHERENASATLLTTAEIDPTGYGRIVRAADGGVDRIVETRYEEDATPEELAIREVNVGAYAFAPADLLAALDQVEEVRGERYLTEAIPALIASGKRVVPHPTTDVLSSMGVNDRADLMEIEAVARRQLLHEHARGGVTFTAPDTVTIDAAVAIGEDTTIGPGVALLGETSVGASCRVGPNVTATDTTVADEVTVAHAVLDRARVGRGATVGPFAYLRPDAEIGEGAKVGTFVEIKNSVIGPGAKVPHLSYVGDADVGDGANLGASSITANYDGQRKHRTTIGRGARLGIHTSLVAPVTVGDDAYTGAGAVIREDVPDGALGVTRNEQRNLEGRARGEKEEKERE